MLKKPQLVCPAGDLEKLKTAVLFGADAVYAGGELFSLRAQAGNFSDEELARGIEFAHAHGVQVYATVNIYAHNSHMQAIPDYLQRLAALGVDAFIVSDVGIMAVAREVAPQVALHVSTQANCTNLAAARFWQQSGARRVVLAREVSIAEAGEIAAAGIDVEMFIHGAMCMAYSGRCLMSSYMTGRSANLGDCTQPCRWHYRLEEEKRPGEFYGVEQDEWGSYIFNSKDLCLLDYLPQIVRSGIGALKIEGRMKSPYYVANVVRVYRAALDSCWADVDGYAALPEWREELEKVSHRPYGSGFALGQQQDLQIYETTATIRGYDFAGVARSWRAGRLYIEQRNNLQVGDEIEIITPHDGVVKQKLTALYNAEGESVPALPHAKQLGSLPCAQEIEVGSIIRRPSRGCSVWK